MADVSNISITVPKVIDLVFQQNESIFLDFNIFADAAMTTRYDLTDCTVFAEVRKQQGSEVLLSLLPVINDDATGYITIRSYITPDILEDQKAQWDLLLVTPNDGNVYLATGQFRIAPSITRSDSTPTEFVYPGTSLQDLISNMHTRGAITLPFRETEIEETLVTPNRSGGVIRGHGSSQKVSTVLASPLNGSRSSIVAKEAMTVMLEIHGTRQHWSDFSLFGDAWNTVTSEFDKYGTRPDVGISINYDAGLGSGKHLFANYTVCGVDTAFRLGQTGAANNSDMTRFNHGRIEDCDVGFLSLSGQAISHVIDDLEIYFWHTAVPAAGSAGSGIAILVQGGGNLKASNIKFLSHGTFLVYDNNSIYLGPNTAQYEFTNIKVDNAAGSGFKLFDSVTSTGIRDLALKTIFRNIFIADTENSFATDGAKIGTLKGCQEVVIEHGYNLQQGVFNFFGHDSEAATTTRVLKLYDCKINMVSTNLINLIDTGDATHDMILYTHNCTDMYGRHLDDIEWETIVAV